jgi:hypothetical protein
LLIGIAILYFGASGSSGGPYMEPPPSSALNQFQAEFYAGEIIILASIIGLAFILKEKIAQAETA